MNPDDITTAEMVEQRPPLWDKRTKDYHLRPQLKMKWWQEIADHLQKEVPEVKKRWRGIRDYYRALKAARSPPSGSAAVPLTPLQNQYRRYLSFLDPVLQPKPTSTSLGADPDDESLVGFDAVFSDALAEELESEGPPPSPSRPSSAAGQDDNSGRDRAATAVGTAEQQQPAGTPRNPPKRNNPPQKRKKSAAKEEDLEAELRSTVRAMNVATASPHDSFLSSLVPLLNRMDEETCARFKVKIFSEATNLAYPAKQ